MRGVICAGGNAHDGKAAHRGLRFRPYRSCIDRVPNLWCRRGASSNFVIVALVRFQRARFFFRCPRGRTAARKSQKADKKDALQLSLPMKKFLLAAGDYFGDYFE